MKRYILLVGLVFAVLIGQTQTETGSKCYGWGTELAHYAWPEAEIMPGFDQSVIDAEDAVSDLRKDQPWRFGYKYDTDIQFENAGQWINLENGRIWRAVITCPGAKTINLLLEDVFIPVGATLFLYDKARTNKIGAYTFKNNRVEGELGTELIHGEHLVIEYFEPTAVIGEGYFIIANVIHGYRGLNHIQKDLTRALHDAGDCNVDVNCPLGDGFENQIKSVAMIVVGGNGICSGALINNTCDDGTPFFLTANHCLGGSTANWSFRFNWESPPGTESCATFDLSTNPGPPYDQTANGAVVLENDPVSDFALLQIDHLTVDEAADWNLFYAGWDNSDLETITEATGIHHPSGDLKKICRENDAPYHSMAGGAQVWWIDDWDSGVTEPGSSGSPLFDQNHRIVGQLYGGAAACSGLDDNDAYDYYGRFGVSWVNGVSDHLAPALCGTGLINDGFDPNVACEGTINSTETEENCYGDETGTILVNVAGGLAPYTYDIGDGPMPTGLFTGLTAGDYTVVVTDNSGCVADIDITLNGPSALAISYTATYEILGSDGSIDLTVSGGTPGYNYAWSGPGGFTSTVQDPDGLVSGLYNVIVTDANGCTISEMDIEVPSALSIPENVQGISIYPNPSTGMFILKNNGDQIQNLTISDLSGRLIYHSNDITKTESIIDLSGKSNGTYLVQVKTDSGIQIYRVVKH